MELAIKFIYSLLSLICILVSNKSKTPRITSPAKNTPSNRLKPSRIRYPLSNPTEQVMAKIPVPRTCGP